MIHRYRNILLLSVLPLVFGIFMVFLSTKINFEQNDDWAFYRTVRRYMAGDFSQNPIQIFGKSAPLFITQGLMATGFAKIFGFESIPFLTAFISAFNFLFLGIIIFRFFGKNIVLSVLVSSLICLNPLYVYSSLGFMTENYFIFFLLFSIYFYLDYMERQKTLSFAFFNIFMILGFFVRQFSIFGAGAFALVLLMKKQYKHFFVQSAIALGMLVFYYFYFLSNSAYQYKGVEIGKEIDPKYLVTLLIGILITLTAYMFPLLFTQVSRADIKSKRLWALFGCSSIVFFLLYSFYSDTNLLMKGEFPYLGNTVSQKGFFEGDVSGFKFHFMGMHKLYYYWQLVAVLLTPLLITVLLRNYKKIVGFFGSYFAVYFVTLFFVTKIFDRYLIVLMIMFMFMMLENKIKLTKLTTGVIAVFVLMLTLLAYQFSMDFVTTRSYIWSRADQLMESENISTKDIRVTRSWGFTHKVEQANPRYLFSYDNTDELHSTVCCKTLVEEHQISFPFSFYVDPKIYLYKR